MGIGAFSNYTYIIHILIYIPVDDLLDLSIEQNYAKPMILTRIPFYIPSIYQAAIVPSVRHSVPPINTPVSGSRKIICPRPNPPTLLARTI